MGEQKLESRIYYKVCEVEEYDKARRKEFYNIIEGAFGTGIAVLGLALFGPDAISSIMDPTSLANAYVAVKVQVPLALTSAALTLKFGVETLIALVEHNSAVTNLNIAKKDLKRLENAQSEEKPKVLRR